MSNEDRLQYFSRDTPPYDAYKYIRNKLVNHDPNSLLFWAVKYLHALEDKDPRRIRKSSPWNILLLIKWVLLNWDRAGTTKAGHSHFAKVYNAINELHGLRNPFLTPGPSRNLTKFFRQLAFQQFWFQKSSLTAADIGRQVVLFQKLPGKYPIEEKFQAALGISLNSFFELMSATWTAFVAMEKKTSVNINLYEKLRPSLPPGTIESFLKSISLTPTEAQIFLRIQIDRLHKRDNDVRWRAQFFEQSPLKEYPLLNLNGRDFVCYSPSLFEECFRYFVFDKMKLAYGGDFTSAFGKRMEAYVRNSLIEARIRFYTEGTLENIYPNERKVDCLIPSEECTVLVESKAIEMGIIGRVNPNDRVLKTELNRIREAAEQIYNTAHLLRTRPSEEIETNSQRVIGIIVTYKELYLSYGKSLWEEILEKLVSPFLEERGISKELIRSNDLFIVCLEDFDNLVTIAKNNRTTVGNLLSEFSDYNEQAVLDTRAGNQPNFMLAQHFQSKERGESLAHLHAAFDEKFDLLFQKVKATEELERRVTTE